MTNIKTTCFYHPTSVVIVDDNKLFLENLPENLNSQSKYTLFDSPVKALDYLDAQLKLVFTSDDFIGSTDDLASGKSVNVNLPKILSIAENNDRFNIPLVVIVDYDMPQLSGLAFCSKLSNRYKKIMLTAKADDKIAIQAFNDGIINKFISKDDPNVFEKIDQAIHSLQHDFFAELSTPAVKALTTEKYSLFSNPIFQDFLKQFMQKNSITEYYLSDAIGSFLLRNQAGERFWLVMQTDQQIENYLQIMREDDNAEEDIIHALNKKEKLLCLLSESDFNQPIKKWRSYLQDAHTIENLNSVYYAFFKEKNS